MSAAEKSSRKLSFYIIGVILFIWLYSLWADRVTPMTAEARVHSYLVRVASEVTGNVVEVNVKNNQVVEAGSVLFKIDPRNYEIALQSAQANLTIAGQGIGANTAAVAVAQAKVVDAIAARNNAKEQYVRVMELAGQGVLSKADLDNAIESRDRTQASYEAAEASLVQAKQNLGPEGENNPQLLAAMANLEKAQLDLQRTEVLAPSKGIVTNLQLTVGQKASVGTPILTFIDPRGVWISALVRENSLEHIRVGQSVEVVLDALPGRVLHARVDSIGWGTGGSNNIDQNTGFLTADTQSMKAQRYPVNIVFENEDVPKNIRYGSQATVAFFTEQSSFGELLAKLWIRVVSIWTYVS
ncbi:MULTISPECIES: HlyD family secretion protein [Shewanella]|uniref:HlyD family secretion protein n=1 Tax=Shewanella holmiensis TaxID=2952222 RepID=A0A9X2WMB5_9GAMM|nr:MULTISPECIES: HlyD family secretion protein [Shewanella]MCT7942022.1 HlyD family secretion protein [Shewanella holmiensis]MDP5147218.1 HlyD family secretion protein [Shewanella sp. ULN5]